MYAQNLETLTLNLKKTKLIKHYLYNACIRYVKIILFCLHEEYGKSNSLSNDEKMLVLFKLLE